MDMLNAIGSIAAIIAAVVAMTALGLQLRAWHKKGKLESAHQDLSEHPFENLRCWFRTRESGGITWPNTMRDKPDWVDGVEPLILAVGRSSQLILEVVARQGIALTELNLRFFGQEDTKPIVMSLKDPDGRNLGVPDGDNQGGYDLRYSPPKHVAAGRAETIIATLEEKEAWTGELSLLLNTTEGANQSLRVPCTVT